MIRPAVRDAGQLVCSLAVCSLILYALVLALWDRGDRERDARAAADSNPSEISDKPRAPTLSPPPESLSPGPVVPSNLTPNSTASVPAPEATSAPESRSAEPAIESFLARVEVLPSRPNRPGYDRDCSPGSGCVFGPAWSDDTSAPMGHNGCDTRNDVLRRDLTNTVIDPGTHGCVVRSGVLHDPYTGRKIDFVRGYNTSIAVQIDHLIPLAAAWDMGAAEWTPERRAAFANDVDHELLAVDGQANQEKVDGTPAIWLPPNTAFQCDYAIRYLKASIHWDLPITSADESALRRLSDVCR